MKQRYDFIIRGGKVVDGSGKKAFDADLCLEEGKIAFIGKLSTPADGKLLDAHRSVVAPGFIDIHSHSDCFPLVEPQCPSKIADGVTTEVCGNCGVSPFPLSGKFRQKLQEEMTPFGLNVDWRGIEGFFERIARNGIGTNLVMLVGHGALRATAMGYENRRPTRSEMRRMKHDLKNAIEAGAWGMSTGLIYPPGCYAQTDEIAELCRTVADFEGIYATHIRDEGNEIETALREALEVAGRSRVRLEIAHLKLAGRQNWNKIDWLVSALREARDAGIDVAWDRYPYTASSTGLDAILPAWACEGGIDAELDRLKDRQTRRKIIRKITSNSTPDRWSRIVVSYVPSQQHRSLEGKTVAQIAEEIGTSPVEAALDLIAKERAGAGVIIFSMSEENLRRILRQPCTSIGSDASVRSISGPLSRGKPHPRAYGSFSRVLGKYVREEGLLSLEEAIRRMTSLPASRLQLDRRGILKEGGWGDIVVFDPDSIADGASFEQPHCYPTGIEHVFVNGKLAFTEGNFTGDLCGEILRR